MSSTMAHGRSKGLGNGAARRAGRSGDVPLHAVSPMADELAKLRAINSQLMQELVTLREREAQAQRLADRDGLTGLYNRRRMLELLESAIADAARKQQCVGLLFIDLDGFKGINDEYGHAAGDKILTTVAARIAGRVRNSDVVCRYGGDEFVVVLPSVPDAGAVTQVADAIRERVSLPCWIQGSEQRLSASIGQAMCPHDGRTADQLLKGADHAMYRLKARLARPMLSLGSTSHHRPLRRRNDKSQPRSGGHAGGDP
jgi:diguanylate cyclase (GGDEF)-like protein